MRPITGRTLAAVQKSVVAVSIGLLASCCLMRISYAGELSYAVGYFGEYSNNIRRTSVDSFGNPIIPEHDLINSAIVGVSYLENGPAVDAHLLAQAEYRSYMNDNYPDGTFYFADTSVIWRLLPQRLTWVFSDYLSEVTRNSSVPNTPDNREQVNVLNTGPDIFLHLNPVNTLVLGPRYGKSTYSESDLGNHRTGGSLRWLYTASTYTTYSLNYENEKVMYDEQIMVANVVQNENISRQNAYFRAEKRRSRDLFQLDVGVTKIKRDNTEGTSGQLTRLRWTEQLTSGSTAGIVLAGEYLDAETVLLSSITDPLPGTPPVSTDVNELTYDVFYRKRAEIFFKRNGASIGTVMSMFYRDLDFETTPQDHREAGGLLEVSYSPATLLTTTLYGGHLDSKYTDSTRDYRESEAGIRFLYRINSNISTTLDWLKIWRDSTSAVQEFEERKVLFSLQYSSNPLFSLVRR